MSDMRDMMLATLDRIVAETVTATVRQDADLSLPHVGDKRVPSPFPVKLWKALEEAGLTAIAGTGAEGDVTLADAMALVGRSAYHALPAPFAEHVLAGRLLARAGIAAPTGLMTVVPPEGSRGVQLFAYVDGSLGARGLVTGVPGGTRKAHLILAAREKSREMLIVADPGEITIEGAANLAGEMRAEIGLREASVLGSVPLPGAASIIEAEGALMRAVQMAGALQRVLDHCLAWANDRVQFGRPIAKFQAIQHLMAELAGETAAAAAAVDLAVERSASLPDRLAIAIAKARTGEAAGRASAIAHQIFGAMGFTAEHELHYATRRLWAWRNEFGGEAYWQAEIGRQVAAAGADSLWPMLTALDTKEAPKPM